MGGSRILKPFTDVVDSLGSVVSNVATAGLYDFTRGGDDQLGIVGRGVKDAAMTVTGAKAAEEANAIAKDQIAKQEEEMRKQQGQRATDQLNRERQLSLRARALRNAGIGGSTGGTEASGDDIASDFLGV